MAHLYTGSGVMGRNAGKVREKKKKKTTAEKHTRATDQSVLHNNYTIMPLHNVSCVAARVAGTHNRACVRA